MRQVTLSNERPITLRTVTVTRTDGNVETIEVGPNGRLQVDGLSSHVDGAPTGPAFIDLRFAEVASIKVDRH